MFIIGCTTCVRKKRMLARFARTVRDNLLKGTKVLKCAKVRESFTKHIFKQR